MKKALLILAAAATISLSACSGSGKPSAADSAKADSIANAIINSINTAMDSSAAAMDTTAMDTTKK